MYSLDVNFLSDRPDYRPPDQGSSPKKRQRSAAAMTPLYIGIGVGLLLPALVGGLWFVLQQQIAQKEQQETELNAQLQRLQIEEQKIARLNEQIEQVNAETQALATVFNQIKPWSAMLQDIRERVPPGIQIGTVTQTEEVPKNQPAAASPPPQSQANNAKAKNAQAAQAQAQAASTPRPTMKLEIQGTARSFDDVGYFLVTLKRSPFFKGDETQLVKAQLVENRTKLEVPKTQTQGQRVTYTLPKVVEYTISTSISDTPASELLRELDRKGAVGLVTRIRTLQEIQQQKGATQP
ncbi:MAG: PilN domain-containing protein [Symplocastrum torsivum CPER-KK1]|jgi:type IV pilus assembly protein PilN|uniref:PilN domain-containing protein n=1 Tax=Symplocastrum torsivum CPER-KK1 TaxID=450513 RepID=A0A951UEI7_9CYAN|nr:PilN domain-containing protein [Symplocastrum torsivum CPER-KK1]